MNPPVTKLVVRVNQIDGVCPVDPPIAGGKNLYRLVDGRVPVCAKHLYELAMYNSGVEARVVLSVEDIDLFVVEFGLRREDLHDLHEPQDPIFGVEQCVMCVTQPSDGRLCSNDSCNKQLHPKWPTCYCSNNCALQDG